MASIIQLLYVWLIKPILFRFNPELVHDHITKLGYWLGQYRLTRWLIGQLLYFKHPMLQQTIAGILFSNPVGLAAGFDKDAYLTNILPAVGFGFEEIGSITAESCVGNPKPRLWRLPQAKSIVVYYGLKNDGCAAVVQRLRHKSFSIPLGISIAKTNNVTTVERKMGIADYKKTYQAFVQAGLGDYFTINISCPNVYGGEPFIEPVALAQLLCELRTIDNDKPIFLKLPAELNDEQLDALVDVARQYTITGFICSNLVKNRSHPALRNLTLPAQGNFSGKVVEELSNQQIEYLYAHYGREFVIIGCGGIFSAKDAYKKIKLGASLVQVITGMIYEGPQLISQINRGLVQLLQADGYSNIAEAIGKEKRRPQLTHSQSLLSSLQS